MRGDYFMMKLLPILAMLPVFSWAAELARSAHPGHTVPRTFFTLNYNEQHEVANWVGYTLERDQLRNCVGRSSSFRQDPLISTGSATLADYKHSGFDRGHLVPAGDMKFSREAMYDTFYLSNVTPQPSKFNQVRWAQLEGLIRAWALKYERLWIVTGPVLRQSLGWIGVDNKVSVPEEYFKAILRKDKTGYKGVAFLMPTHVPYVDLKLYALDIKSIEGAAQIDVFTFLPDHEERRVESDFQPSDWDFNARFEYLPCAPSAIQ
jgi:endonuclease G, mitochondrial